jgi:hypothetical protein
MRTSGILYLCSLSALTLHIMAVSPSMTPITTAVLAFQFFGWVYQPPAGDQTCLGYLLSHCRQPLDLTTRGFETATRTGPWRRLP